MQRRNIFANKDMKQLDQIQKHQEGKEDKSLKIENEDPRDIKGLDLTKHLKRKKKSRKRCWICRSPIHFKNRCPYIRCFWCHKLGHTKATCDLKMIKYIYHRGKRTLLEKRWKWSRTKRKERKKRTKGVWTEDTKTQIKRIKFKIWTKRRKRRSSSPTMERENNRWIHWSRIDRTNH